MIASYGAVACRLRIFMCAKEQYIVKELEGPSLRFTPSRFEGLPDVAEVIVYPGRLEVLSAGRWLTFRFVDMVRWPRPVWLRKWLFRFGSRLDFLAVADRDWFHPNKDRFFSFYTEPRLVVYMPLDEPEDHDKSHFRRIKAVLHAGGFSSFDLG